LATLSTSRSSHLIAQGHSTAQALTSGYHLAFWIAAALTAAAIAIVPVVHGERRSEREHAPLLGAEATAGLEGEG
ncbi:MAG TPA: MFS transporter, partial [Solirubrobacteraceae bacterium]|nr:MFS transporter [Solirubrobacteraceae bacterium]